MKWPCALLLCAGLVLLSCEDDPTDLDHTRDSGSASDAGDDDAGSDDAGTE